MAWKIKQLIGVQDKPRCRAAGSAPAPVRLYYEHLFLMPVLGLCLGLLVALSFNYDLTPDVNGSGLAPAESLLVHRHLLNSTRGNEDIDNDWDDDDVEPVNGPPGTGADDEDDVQRILRTLKFYHLWQDDKYEKYVFANAAILNQMMIFISGTILLYLIMVNILSCFVLPFIAPAYRELDVFGQMAVTTNVMYTILLLLQLIPYTIIIIGILFGDQRSREFPSFYYAVFVFLTTHAIMYAYEGIVRSVIKVNYLLLVHHSFFFVFMILEFVVQSNFVVKACLILDYFVVWEAGLYLTNVLYRLKANYYLLKWTMIVGTTVHGVTHLLQAALLTAFFVGMGKRMEQYHISKGIFAIMVILCTLLVFYQYYLEKIFYEMWLKVAKAHAAKRKKDLEAAEEEEESDEDNEEQKEKQANSQIEHHPLLNGAVSSNAMGNGSQLGHRTSLRRGSRELTQLTEEENTMLGELPSFPKTMVALHLPRDGSLKGGSDGGLELSQSRRSSMTRSDDGKTHVVAAQTISAVPTAAVPTGAAPAVPLEQTGQPPAPKPAKPKKKKMRDGLTIDDWEESYD
mmetsp:Transcript_24475/g.53464  ORF Transcript_24475/g.53464 Transcript_24475/m.53464 type:complete len:569 (-) Transcript_24475:360-2066(-)|eukprot:CAMPEP_0202904606 /NCGR_PEP_ID=MMETSP1392-20130828/30277_1 /ASSEMBLY_ACC=CAM_ASM_000868 /TAXON_ID=225041 /ORGANISM="Chlamydomonas chlamydogama, Strain SAG 11-48b" /LENGTH=568 /DNA_ID=CAMNT_0049592317 /DNA_START=181 /DNA_END=1887 /DNA_ORIENTATION=+